VYNSVRYAPKNFQPFFYMQETNILIIRFTQLFYSLIMWQ